MGKPPSEPLKLDWSRKSHLRKLIEAAIIAASAQQLHAISASTIHSLARFIACRTEHLPWHKEQMTQRDLKLMTRRSYLAPVLVLLALLGSPVNAQIQVDKQTSMFIQIGGKAMSSIPTVGPILSGAVGFLFSSKEAEHDALRNEWEQYTNEKIETLDSRLSTQQANGYINLLRSIESSESVGNSQGALDGWKQLNFRLIEDVDKFRNVSDRATPRLPLFLAVTNLHLEALLKLKSLSGGDPQIVRDYSIQYNNRLQEYKVAWRAEFTKVLNERVAKIKSVVGAPDEFTSSQPDLSFDQSGPPETIILMDGATGVWSRHGYDSIDPKSVEDNYKALVWNQTRVDLTPLAQQSNGTEWNFEQSTLPDAMATWKNDPVRYGFELNPDGNLKNVSNQIATFDVNADLLAKAGINYPPKSSSPQQANNQRSANSRSTSQAAPTVGQGAEDRALLEKWIAAPFVWGSGLSANGYYLVLNRYKTTDKDTNREIEVSVVKGPYNSQNDAKAYLNPEHPELVTTDLAIATGASLATDPKLAFQVYTPTPAIVAIPTSKNSKLYVYPGETDLKICDNDILSMVQSFARRNNGTNRVMVIAYGTLPSKAGTGEPINRNPRKEEPCSFFFSSYGTDGKNRAMPLIPGSDFNSFRLVSTDSLAVYPGGQTDLPLAPDKQQLIVQDIKNYIAQGHYVILPSCYSKVWAERMGL